MGHLDDDDIYELVRDAGLDWHMGWGGDDDAPNRYVTLARAAFAAGVREGRERAAKRCDQWADDWPYDPPRRFVALECAAAIRAQGGE